MTEYSGQRTAWWERLRRIFIKCSAQRTKICLLIKQLAIQLTQQKALGKLLVMSSVFCLLACKEPLYLEQRYIFGTLVEVSVYGEHEARAKKAMAAVMQEFQRLHDQLHAWQPSELSELNAAFAQGREKEVSPELAAIVRDAAQLSAQSGGLFNPAIGGIVRLWGFQADEFKALLPDEKQLAEIVAARPQGIDLSLTPALSGRERVRSYNKAVQLDLGGYAKGYALDRAAEILREQDIPNALVNIGGNVLALGKHGSRAWRVGIQHPRQPGPLATLELHDGEAIGTSGDYQRYFEVAGQRYCHVMDPRTGRPVQGVQAATVVTRGPHAGVLSDVASKPLFVAGVAGWRNAARNMNVTEALLIDSAGTVHLTAAMQKRLEFTDPKIIKAVDETPS